MRLIDADALNIDFYDEYETEDDAYAYAYVSMYQIDTAPSIDIVRCRECKHENSCEHQVLLSTMWGEVEDTADIDYCSYGEREDND